MHTIHRLVIKHHHHLYKYLRIEFALNLKSPSVKAICFLLKKITATKKKLKKTQGFHFIYPASVLNKYSRRPHLKQKK